LGYDIAHSTASGFSPMIATILAQKVNPTAPGIIYTVFAFIAFIGLAISTQIHHDDSDSCAADNGAVDSNIPGTSAFEQEASKEREEPAETTVNPIV
jgi:hypothetical protein